MVKKITITICAMIIVLSTIFIGQNIVKADEIQEYYSFTGSNIFIPFSSDKKTHSGFLLIKVKFSADTIQPQNYQYSVNINTTAFYNIYTTENGETNTNKYNFYAEKLSYAKDYTSNSKANYTLSKLPIIANEITYNDLMNSGYFCTDSEAPTTYTTNIHAITFLNSKDFVPNITTIMLGHGFAENQPYNYIRYVDNNNNFFEIAVRTNEGIFEWSGQTINMFLENRIYIANGTGNEYNNGYILGYENGKEEGKKQGKEIGYKDGYDKANTELYNKWYIGRYQQGYNEGTKNAGNYTFLSLMGSIVDAPIKVISNMLNFEILGFNMMQFFYAIITVCIIVTIVKFLI